MPDPQNRVWWWNLDRNGNPIDTTTFEPRKPDMPAIKDGSPYTPTFLVDGKAAASAPASQGRSDCRHPRRKRPRAFAADVAAVPAV